MHFSSKLFEGKGTDDESWGLDNVRVDERGQTGQTYGVFCTLGVRQ
jgi:hypothetical protein